MTTLSEDTLPRVVARQRATSSRWIGMIDRFLDTTTVAFAAWTLLYVVASWTHAPADAALVVWLLSLPGCRWLSHRVTSVKLDERAPQSMYVMRWSIPLRVVAVGCALLCGVIVAVRPWTVTNHGGAFWAWLVAFVAVTIALFAAAVMARHGRDQPGERRHTERAVVTTVLVIAVALGIFSLFVIRHDGDDTYYVNREEYVAQTGTFPSRDTIFSNQVYPVVEPAQVSSYEGFVGSIASLLGLSAGDIAYFVIAPVGTFLAVLALWRLLRVWGARFPLLALAVGIVFLLMDGGPSEGFGNLFLARMWTGKVILAVVAVPLIYAQLAGWSERRERRGLALLAMAGIAAVGLSSTALIIVPMVAVVGLSSLVIDGAWGGFFLGCACTAAYPVLVSIFLRLDGAGFVPPVAAGTDDPAILASQVAGTGVLAAIAVGAALAGWVGFDSRRGRMAAAVASALVVILLAPGILPDLGHVLTATPIYWRLTWVLPMGAMVGSLATAALGRGHGVVRRIGMAGVVAVPLALCLFGTPVWSAADGGTLVATPAWKFDPGDLADAQRIVASTRAGEIVLAPSPISEALTVVTTRVKPVNPRSDYVATLSVVSGFHGADRLLLQPLADGTSPAAQLNEVNAALHALGVGMACVAPANGHALMLLSQSGYKEKWRNSSLVCLASPH